MPTIRVMYWNIENFGVTNGSRDAVAPYCQYIADVAAHLQADVILIEEVKQQAILGGVLFQRLQRTLNTLPAPFNNWYYDWIKGAIAHGGAAPYATFADLDWDSAHHEGYAVFWNQNIAKFKLTPAPDIQPPAGVAVANTQSSGVCMQGLTALVLGVPQPGSAVPAGGIAVPVGLLPYTLPTGSVIGVAPPLAAPQAVASATVIPAGSTIGAAGITQNAVVHNVNPVVVPGNFVLTDALTLPAAATVVVPEHALSLTMFGRNTGNPPATFTGDISGATAAFVPAGVNNWDWLYFTRGAGFPAGLNGVRRPAYTIMDVNRPAFPAAADRLVPLTVYHAPAAMPASSSGMQRAAYSRQMYQAYDPAVPGWIDCNNAVLGGDINVRISPVAYCYTAFSGTFAALGANCTMSLANPAPPPTPGNPAPTQADNPLNKTMVRLRNFNTQMPVYSANFADYRTRAIDNIFYRGAGAPATVYNSLTGAAGFAPIIPVATISAFIANTDLTALDNAMNLHLPLPPLAPEISAPVSFIFDMNQGQFGSLPNAGIDTAARRSAEFVKLCVSDHQPLAVQMAL